MIHRFFIFPFKEKCWRKPAIFFGRAEPSRSSTGNELQKSNWHGHQSREFRHVDILLQAWGNLLDKPLFQIF